MFNRFTAEAREAIVRAQEIARLSGAKEISDSHVLCAAIQSPVGHVLVRLAGVDPASITERLRSQKSDDQVDGHIPFTKITKQVIEQSLRESINCAHAVISSGHLVAGAAAVRRRSTSRAMLREFGLGRPELRRVLESFDFLEDDIASEAVHKPLFSHVKDDDETSIWLLQDQIEWAIFKKADLTLGRNILAEASQRHGRDAFAFQAVIIGELSGDVSLIIEDANQAVDQRPELAPEIRAALALALAENDRAGESKATLEMALDERPSATALVDAAKAQLVNDDPESAREYVQRARSADGSHHEAIQWQIEILEHRISDNTAQLQNIARSATPTCYLTMLGGIARALLTPEDDPTRAVEGYDAIAGEYLALGMHEPALEALARKAGILGRINHPTAEEVVHEAVALAEQLGRIATARRLQKS